jgi:general stress protein 26
MNSGFKYFCSLIFVFIFFLYLPGRNIYAQESELSNSERDTLLSVARQYIENVKYCALITIDSTGYPHARTMDPFQPDEKWIVWLATNPKSRKVNEIRNNQKVTLYYTGNKGVGYVSIIGTARIVNDQSKKDSLWKDGWSRFYKNRKEDYLLIQVVPKRLELLDYKQGIVNNKETWRTPSVTF